MDIEILRDGRPPLRVAAATGLIVRGPGGTAMAACRHGSDAAVRVVTAAEQAALRELVESLGASTVSSPPKD